MKEKMPAASSDAATNLSNLLARIHRDGGHYEGEHGTAKAFYDADCKVIEWLARDDAALSQTTTVHQAEPTDVQMEQIADAIWGAQKKRLPMSAAIEFARAVLALKGMQPDAYNRKLRAQLEQEWSNLQHMQKSERPEVVKAGTVTTLMGDLCIVKLDGFVVRKGDVLYVAKG